MNPNTSQPNILGIIVIIVGFIILLYFLWKSVIPSDITQK